MSSNLLQMGPFLAQDNLIIFISGLTIALTLLVINLSRSSSILEGIFSLSAISGVVGILYLVLDAPDVAMTEAAIGACISTVILIQFASRINNSKVVNSTSSQKIIGLIIALGTTLLFIKIGVELPVFGQANNPLQISTATKHYILNTEREIGIPAFVAAILASYRGLDTLGETTVILIAAISILLIMGGYNGSKK